MCPSRRPSSCGNWRDASGRGEGTEGGNSARVTRGIDQPQSVRRPQVCHVITDEQMALPAIA